MIHCDGRILISFVFPQSTSFHSVFHSFHGLMNSINWPASSVWVFIAQLGEHCSANAEATGSNPVEAPKIFFSGYFRNCLNCDSLRWSHTHFIYMRGVIRSNDTPASLHSTCTPKTTSCTPHELQPGAKSPLPPTAPQHFPEVPVMIAVSSHCYFSKLLYTTGAGLQKFVTCT